MASSPNCTHFVHHSIEQIKRSCNTFQPHSTLICSAAVLSTLADDNLFVVALFRLSTKSHVTANTLLELHLSNCDLVDVMSEMNDTVSKLLTGRRRLYLASLIHAINRAASDHRISALLVRASKFQANMTQLDELRRSIVSFRATGKTTFFYTDTFEEYASANLTYWFASAFEHIVMAPCGTLNFLGLKLTSPFVKKTLEKIDIQPEIYTRSDYKTFANFFMEDQFTPEHAEIQTMLLNSISDYIIKDIAKGRKMEESQIRSLISQGPFSPQLALNQNLITSLHYEDDFYDQFLSSWFANQPKSSLSCRIQSLFSRSSFQRGYDLLSLERYHDIVGQGPTFYQWFFQVNIAYIQITGTIVLGETPTQWLGGHSQQSTGSDTVRLALRQAVDDKSIRAILIRVDSPGGSAVASDLISHSIELAKAAGKKVVVLMGQYAASGGYYVSSHADKIVSNALTITGSIGVVAGKFNLSGFFNRLGITFDAVQHDKNADFYDSLTGFNDENRAILDQFLDRVYDQFKTNVSTGRKISMDKVEELAQGKVWMGLSALDISLVDHIGGLDVAQQVVRDELGLSPNTHLNLVQFPKNRSIWKLLCSRHDKHSRELQTTMITNPLRGIHIHQNEMKQNSLNAILALISSFGSNISQIYGPIISQILALTKLGQFQTNSSQYHLILPPSLLMPYQACPSF